jgi:RNA polymerase sigma factor (sigma-70 family)
MEIRHGLGLVRTRSRHLTPRQSQLGRTGWAVTESTLEQAMQAYVGGDVAAFARIYRRVAPALYSYLLRLTRDRPRAEDLLQITFAKVHGARSSYIPGAPPVPWMLAIAHRAFLDEQRTKRSRFEDLSQDGRLPERPEPKEFLSDDLSDALERALEGLPERYRHAIHLTKITGLSLNEAADVLDTTPLAVKLRVHRGYSLMRDRFATLQSMTT